MIFILLLATAAMALYFFLKQPKFGKLPFGKRLDAIEASPNFKHGKFHNLNFTPDLTEGETYLRIIRKVLFEKDKRNKPKNRIPSQKTDLRALNPDENVLVWFGHSSYFLQLEGKTILVDPVFSGAASPIKATTRSFAGSDIYTVDDIPEIDFLFLSHDHWDHLDYETVIGLKPKVKNVITGLGTGEHLEYWGFSPEIIFEKDWDEHIDLGDGFMVNTTTARHFAGRLFSRNKALWMSFVLQTPKRKIYLGGDSGFDNHFEAIGNKFGPFDLAILECGQYNESWKYIHMFPEELITASKNLKTKTLMPVHWGKFALANHAWDEPIKRVSVAAEKGNLSLLTPMIGQKVNLDFPGAFEKWWENVN
jgi:L-ascorbate metabolism protein UlaG (beta-lactamase superfamily)